jgi:type IV pilus assembly protein PilB
MKKTLLEVLQDKKLLTDEQIKDIKFEATNSSRSYEVVILEKGLLDEETIAKSKAEAYELPFMDLKGVTIPPSLISKIDPELLKRYLAVPIEDLNDKIKVAMANPVDLQAVQALKTRFGRDIEIVMALREDIITTIEKQSGEAISTQVDEALEDVGEAVTNIQDTIQDISQVTQGIEKAPVARIINTILELAVRLKSSDVHIEPEEEGVRMRLRINGVLQEKMFLPKTLKASIASRIKIMARLKIDEKRIPQDGQFQILSKGNRVDIRVSIIPTVYGEKVVLRIQERIGGIPQLEASGMRGSSYKIYLEAIRKTTGIVLVTGPTGSGKTRTLAGTLDKLNKPGVNIITLEDPAEIRIKGVNQVQVNPDVGLTFATGLRSILRQDPNIVMVGEIRDGETARLAVQAALTGQLVLSTLHTNNAAGALPRLLDMGIEPYLIASTVQCVVAQRLPRTICQHCREAYLAPPEVVNDIKTVLNWRNFSLLTYLKEKAKYNNEADPFASPPRPTVTPPPDTASEETPQIYLYRGKGCEKCDGNGYTGRVGIFEVMHVSEKIAKMIMEHKTAAEIQNKAIEEGMVTMMQDGYLKAIEGVTTIEETLRVARD